MKRNYIGLACTGHDNAIAVVNHQGEVLFAEATERYTQIKRAINCPPDNTMHTVEHSILPHCDLDHDFVIAKSWSNNTVSTFNNERNKARDRASLVAESTAEPILSQDIETYCFVMNFAELNISNAGQHLDFYCRHILNKQPIHRAYEHHLTHAITGCHSSPFDEAACMVVDGFGEGISISYYHFREGRLEHIDISPMNGDIAQSLGIFYGMICGLCGFDVWSGEEWKVMGLAPYGKLDPNIEALLKNRIQVDGLKLACPPSGYDSLSELMKYARKPNSPAHSVADLAYTGQKVFADLMVELINNFYQLGLSKNLVIGGGCGLNSAFNGTILEKTPFDNLHIFSATADDGNAIGAALLAYAEDHDKLPEQKKVLSPYLGSSVSQQSLDHLKKYSGLPNISYLPDQICQRTAELLKDGKIIAWIQGRAEFGPRALGNRSILADPSRSDMKDRINASIKFREEFRPFAPSILHEFGEEYFINYQESPYMERTLAFRPEAALRVPAVVHVDGTGRLQTVKQQWNPKFYQLISEFNRLTGIPILLNTSLNVMGKPIVHDVEDAIATFFLSGLDALIIDDYLIEKG